MKAVAIVQARTGSSRLPGKVLLEVAGEPMLAHQIRRLQRVEELDDIVVATTLDPADDPVVAVAEARVPAGSAAASTTSSTATSGQRRRPRRTSFCE